MIRILETCKEDIQTEGKARFADTNTDIYILYEIIEQ